MNFNLVSLIPVLLSVLGREQPEIEKPLAAVINAIGRLPRRERETEIVPIDLRAAQSKLATLGYECGLIDGDPGPLTRAAVKKFQEDKDLVTDGLIGQKTWAALMYDHEEEEEED